MKFLGIYLVVLLSWIFLFVLLVNMDGGISKATQQAVGGAFVGAVLLATLVAIVMSAH